MRLIRSSFKTLLPGILLTLAACSNGVDWSEREQRNGEQVFESLAAVSDAARIANTIDSAAGLESQKDELLANLRRAHLLASQVDTRVLDKLHPRMYSKFRLGYQKALARMIDAYQRGDIDAAERAAADIQDFMEWFRNTRHEFRWWDPELQQ